MANSESADRMARLAGAFLDVLDDQARAAATIAFAEEKARRDWHYIPRRRAGLAFLDMDAAQQKAVYDLVASGVSGSALAAVTTIIGLEDVLDELEGKGRGRHRADYSVTVFGEPGRSTWGWRFEGHHVSINVSVVDGAISSAPLFLGANPAEVRARSGSVVVRPLAGEEDLALHLVASLSPALRDEAMLGTEAPDDILTTNAPTLDELPALAGVRLGAFDGAASDAGRALIDHYLDRLPRPEAEGWRRRLAPELGEIRFAFAGVAEHLRPQYYRLAGPSFFVEYDNTQNEANHVHTVLRDPTGDFGDDLLRAHVERHHAP